ncbi:MAG: urate hydroxylase PuuD [Acidobacteriota bacterium]
MLPESMAQVPTAAGIFLWFDSLVHPTFDDTFVQMLVRHLHFLAGVTWIGILYFFNLVNVPFMKTLDGPTKGKVIPELMPRALWWFRWGAVLTVLSGLMYYAMYIVASDKKNMDAIGSPSAANFSTWGALGIWIVIVLVSYAIIYGILQPVSGALNKGAVLAVLIGIVVLAMSAAILYMLGVPDVSNRTLSIGIGGGMGVIMFLNVWGIIWPAQKKIIAWTKENAEKGTAIPAESAKLARRAFLASRTNAWLSIFMLFLMGASTHYGMFGK